MSTREREQEFYDEQDRIIDQMPDLQDIDPKVNLIMKKVVTAIPVELSEQVGSTVAALATLISFLIDTAPQPEEVKENMRQAVMHVLRKDAMPFKGVRRG